MRLLHLLSRGSAALFGLLLIALPSANGRELPFSGESSVVTMNAPAALRAKLQESLNRGLMGNAKIQENLLFASFEGSWPRDPWVTYHADGAAEVEWGRTTHRSSHNNHSIWCAGAGAEAPDEGSVVPVSTASWAVAGPFDLSNAATGTLNFDLWLSTEPFYDNFLWLASTDGQEFTGKALSTNTNGWKSISTDLATWPDDAGVLGQPTVWIAFVYLSDRDGQFEGAYVDYVRLAADEGQQTDTTYTYTTDQDFADGSTVGLVADADALTMSSQWTTFPYLWVPLYDIGAVAKVDTETGAELGRYWTGPADIALGPAPIAVDLEGDCWVGNRVAGSVVKIGLAERRRCVDRDGDGTITTSSDADGNGSIDMDEMFDWGEDECVLFETVLREGSESVHAPGDDHGLYADIGVETLAVDGDNDLWAGVTDTQMLYRIDASSGAVARMEDLEPYGARCSSAVVDGGGNLWCASWPDLWVLKIPADDSQPHTVALPHGSNRLALDGDDGLLVSGFEHSAASRIDLASEDIDWSLSADYGAAGMAVNRDGLWFAAAPLSGIVRKYSTDGIILDSLNIANSPSAAAFDADGKLWVSGWGSGVLIRLNPELLVVEGQPALSGAQAIDASGDQTGIVVRTVTAPTGSWTVIVDTQVEDTAWGTLAWDATEPEGSAVTVRVRSSNDQVVWSDGEQATSGEGLSATPSGRYLEVEVTMRRSPSGDPPVLSEITITPGQTGDGSPVGLVDDSDPVS